jgi:amino acid transporter
LYYGFWSHYHVLIVCLQSEETKSSDRSGPYSIISAVIVSIVVGYAYLVGVTFAVTDLEHVLDVTNDANGYAVAQVFYDAFRNRYGSGTGGILCLGVVAVAIFFCGMSSITSNSRFGTSPGVLFLH